jgi:hypothetical protein
MEDVPATTAEEAEAYLLGCSIIVNHFCEGPAGGQFANLVTFG